MIEPKVIAYLTRDDMFGSQTKLARAAGCEPHTICGKRNSANPLTYQQMRRILEKGPEMGVFVTPEDFFPEFTAGLAKAKRKKAA